MFAVEHAHYPLLMAVLVALATLLAIGVICAAFNPLSNQGECHRDDITKTR